MNFLISFTLLSTISSLDTADTEFDADIYAPEYLEHIEDFYEEMMENLNQFFDAFDSQDCDSACISLGYDSPSPYSSICVEECENYKIQMSQDFQDPDYDDLDDDGLFDEEDFDEFYYL